MFQYFAIYVSASPLSAFFSIQHSQYCTFKIDNPSDKNLVGRYFLSFLHCGAAFQCVIFSKSILQSGSGFTSLCAHIQNSRAIKLQFQALAAASSELNSFLLIVSPRKTIQLYGWLHLITKFLLSFSVCKSASFRKHTKQNENCRRRLTAYIESLT